MNTIPRYSSDTKPPVFLDLESGYWYYHYDIQEYSIKDKINGEPKSKFSYSRFRIAGKPDYKKCVETVIRGFISQSQEFDLINSINAGVFNLLSEEESSEEYAKYIEYLNLLKDIKSKVKADFNLQ